MVIRTQCLENVDSLQQKLYLPLAWARKWGDVWNADPCVVEFKDIVGGSVEVQAVNPKLPPTSKRYKVVEHHGSAWVSVPRSWLQMRNARSGDSLRMEMGDAGQLILTLDRKVA